MIVISYRQHSLFLPSSVQFNKYLLSQSLFLVLTIDQSMKQTDRYLPLLHLVGKSIETYLLISKIHILLEGGKGYGKGVRVGCSCNFEQVVSIGLIEKVAYVQRLERGKRGN